MPNPDCNVPVRTFSDSEVDEKEQIRNIYEQMYAAMIRKDETALRRFHAADFVLIHMTGMRQSREQYIKAIADGTLNYFNVQTERLDIQVQGNHAVMTGRSRVEAAVFGGGRHTWPLELRFHLRKDGGEWLLTEARASTY